MSVLSTPEGCEAKPGRADYRKCGQLTFLQRACRDALMRSLSAIRNGSIFLRDPNGTILFGDGAAYPIELRIADARTYTTLATRGTLGAAAAYIDGWWDSDDLVGLFRLLTRNADTMASLDGTLSRWVTWALSWIHRFRRNTIAGSRENIRAHYDLSNEFFALFLDETMAYSGGIFSTPRTTLAEASTEKFDRICRLLNLTSRDHVLEIGTGWGGFAIHAVRNYGCKVTTTTISRKQYDFARQRVDAAGLNDRVTVLCEDYRSLHGAYDKLASIEMIEAVGHEFLDTFFRQCSRLLRSNGAMALQTITIPDQRYENYRRSVDFIQQYIFPGGCIPSLSAISVSLRRSSDFGVTRLDDFGSHYAETLKHWRTHFWRNVDAVRGLGFDERFVRMWHYYLCYCEAGFLDCQIGLAQILLTKPGGRLTSPI